MRNMNSNSRSLIFQPVLDAVIGESSRKISISNTALKKIFKCLHVTDIVSLKVEQAGLRNFRQLGSVAMVG